MKLKKDEFKKLQKHWYEKLAQHGFKDIEKFKGDDLVLLQSAYHCYQGTDVHSRVAKEEYYRAMAKAAMDESTIYRNAVDRLILLRHVEGIKIKVIVAELTQMGMPRHRHSVRFIIRKYEMAWGFRYYNKTQLNIKKAI